MQCPTTANPMILKEKKNQIKINKNRNVSQFRMGRIMTKAPNTRLP